jgi:hypothetical protein
MGKSNKVSKRRFIIATSMIGKGWKVEVETRTGNKFDYDHDEVYNLLKKKFESMPCFNKYGNYTNSNNMPKFVREALAAAKSKK